MSDLHEWLAAARLGAYETLVREYAADLDDIAELTSGDVDEITDQIKEKVKKRKFAAAFEHAVEHSRRGAPMSALLFKVRRVVLLLFCHLQTFVDDKTFTLFSAPLCSQGHAEGGGAASASSAGSASTTADVLGGQSAWGNMDRAPVAGESRADPRTPTSCRRARRRPRRNLCDIAPLLVATAESQAAHPSTKRSRARGYE